VIEHDPSEDDPEDCRTRTGAPLKKAKHEITEYRIPRQNEYKDVEQQQQLGHPDPDDGRTA
jgi:hypothetical protein